eukprot:4407472-Karenia_brevis.AAC.1
MVVMLWMVMVLTMMMMSLLLRPMMMNTMMLMIRVLSLADDDSCCDYRAHDLVEADDVVKGYVVDDVGGGMEDGDDGDRADVGGGAGNHDDVP